MTELKEILRENHISLAHCASKSGISYSRMAQIIYGTDPATNDELARIEEASGLHIFLRSTTRNV